MSKTLRLLIGLPFVVIFWLGVLVVTPIILVAMWVFEGHVKYFDKTDLILPIKFIRYVINN